MKNFLMKVLPIVFGFALGFLLMEGQFSVSGFGVFGIVGLVLVVAVLFLAFVAFVGVKTFPKGEALSVAAGPPEDPRFVELVRDCLESGFVEAGPVFRVAVSPEGLLKPLVHGTEPIYAAVFRSGTIPALVGIDLVSILEGDRGGLTTNPDRKAGTIPGDALSFRQIIVGADLPQLLQAHREAMRFLTERGVVFRGVSADQFRRDFQVGMDLQRAAFLNGLAGNTLKAVWRTLTGRSPYVGPVAAQKETEGRIKAIVG